MRSIESKKRPTFGTRLQAFVCRLFLLCLFTVTSSLTAAANPLDGTVVKGQASITSSAGTVDIIQTTKRAVIDWRSFNIGANETTNFHQPSASSVTLNRVNTPDPSRIDGNLNANGRVILINPNGVFFGQGSKVDVNGLVATTADTNNDQFMRGKMNFNIAGNPNATVSNAGSITAGQAGLVGLVAPNVSNSGTIDAKMGKVTLGSGDTFTMDLYGDGLINVGVSDAVQSQVINQTGRINAAGGTIQITAGAGRQAVNSLVNVSGELNAPSAGVRNGKIIISAEGANKTTKTGNSTVIVDGKLDVSGRGAGQTGGTVEITGDYVGLLRNTRIDAAGDRGGGTVRVGGDYLGGGKTPTAKKTIVQQGAEIDASAVRRGNGGKVTVWADDRTDYHGQIKATGGAAGGNGGFVETSGKQFLNLSGTVDASAAKGKAGSWLLDPNNVVIQAAGVNTNVAGNPNFVTTNDSAIITTGSIQTALNAGTSVTVTTGTAGANTQAGNITITDNIDKTAGGDATLTLIAHNNISMTGGRIRSTSNKLHVVLNADSDSSGVGSIYTNRDITTNGGNITMGGGADPTTTAARGNNNAGNDGIFIDDADIDAGGGNIIMRGQAFAHTGDGNYGVDIIGSSAIVQTSGTGTITIVGTSAGSGADSDRGHGVNIQGGAVVSTASGDITITGTGGGAGTGDENYGVFIEASTIQATASGGDITITGTGGNGAGSGIFNTGILLTTGGTVSAAGGAISITGTGGTGSGIYNRGVSLEYDAVISNTGSGTITIVANGAGSGATTIENHGIELYSNSIITAVDGNISVTGTGGTGDGGNHYGVWIGTGTSAITTTGSGDISVTGQGGSGGGDDNYGVFVETADGIHTAGSGDITVTGQGGSGTGWENFGVSIYQGSVTASGGNISIDGTGGVNSGSFGVGVEVYGAGTGVSTTGAGTINISGFGGGAGGGDSSDNYGVVIGGDAVVSTVNGDLTVYGLGGGAGNGSQNFGVYTLNTGSGIMSSGAGDVDVTGVGGVGDGDYNYGIMVDGDSFLKAAGSGAVTVDGTGGSGTGWENYGVILDNAGLISAAGGALSIDATGGAGAGTSNSGFVMEDASFVTNTGAGTITIIANGSGGGNSANSSGVAITEGSIVSAVNGNIDITATGGGAGGGSDNYGILVYDAGSAVTTTGAGHIFVTGTGGNDSGTGGTNPGVYLEAGGVIHAAGSGNITVTGTGGNGSSDGWENVGVNLDNGGSIIASGGNVLVTGTGGAGTGYFNGGVEVADGSFITTTGTGTVTVTGIAGANGVYGGYGIEVDSSGVISSVDGLLTVTGTGGGGIGGAGSASDHWGIVVQNAGSAIVTTGTGSIVAIGQGGVNTSGNRNHGVYVADAATISASGAGAVTVTGTGGNDGGTGSDNTGIRIDGGSIMASGGAISLTGTGGLGDGDWNSGIDIGTSSFASGSIVSNTGTGTITLMATGIGDDDTSHALGLDLWGDGVVTAEDGNISITGIGGGGGGGTENFGISIDDASITSSGSGSISLTGTGSTDAGTGDQGTGVKIANASSITAGSGSITVTGTGSFSSGNGNFGVQIYTGSTLSTVDGNISVTGTGGANSGSTWGIELSGASTITSTGEGDITLTGTGGSGSSASSIGIEVWSDGQVIGHNGDVSLTGTGGSGAGTSGNYGVWLDEYNVNRVTTTGSGNISVTGTGGNSSGGNNIGVLLEEDNTIYAQGSGNITVTGTGGGTGSNNYGISVLASANRTPVRSDGAGDITITSTGANGATDLIFSGAVAIIGSAAASGDITFIQDTATWGSARINTSGTVFFTPRSVNTSVGVAGGAGTLGITSAILNTNGLRRATLVVIGRSDGTGAMNVNARTWTTANCPLCSALLRTGSGVMTIAGAQTLGSNNLTLQTDSDLVLSAALTGTGTLTIQPSDNATSMGLDGASGTLNLSTAELGQLTNGWGSIVLGRTTGAGDINANDFTWSDNVTIQNGSGDITLNGGGGAHNFGANALTMTTASGGDITVGGDTTVGAFSAVATGGGNVSLAAITAATIFARTTGGSGDITLTGNSSASAAGDAIVLASSHDFHNLAGAGALTTPAGRWLSYSTVYSDDTVGGLTESFHRFGCTYGGSCPAYPGVGNGFLYVNAPNLTITPVAIAGVTYGDLAPSLVNYTYTISGYVGSDGTSDVVTGSVDGSTLYAQGSNAGTYSIDYASGALSSTLGYGFTYANNATGLVVGKRALTATVQDKTVTYGTATPTLDKDTAGDVVWGNFYGADNAAAITGATFSYGGATAGGFNNAGSYTLGVSAITSTNYTLGTVTTGTLTINPYALSVTADAQGKTYGAADPALTYTNGALQNGDTAAVFSGGLTRAAGENVGGYAIGQGTLSAGSNYTISYTGANLTITPYALSVTADAQAKTYGAADPALTYTNGALQNGDTAAVFSGALTRAAGENVGAYAIGQGTLSAGSNYTISYTGANLTITPYALSVTADAQGKTYGAADPALTYTNSALQNGDTAAVFSGALTRAAGENVGAYAIGQGTLSAGSNYTISYTGANLTITPYALSVTADAQGKTYGAADPALTYTNGALQNGDTAAVFSGALARAAGENVGAYAIGQGTLSAGSNYTISYTGANLTITPYALSVTADAQGKTYGAADPALTYTNGALQNGDTAAVFSGALTRAAGENVGAYAIGQGTLSAGANYTISYTGANLTITPYALSVTADAQGKTYGAADPALTYTNGALQNGDTAAVFSGALTRAAGENVGAYAIGQGTLSAGANYTISYTGANLTITPYALSVTADAQGKTYGAADPALTYTNGALQNGDTAAVFSGALARAAGENVGAYAIGQGTLSAGSNYTISYTGANLTITPYALSVTADAQGKTYGAADPALTYTNGALQNGDTAAVFSGGLTRAAGENVGAYAIGQGTLSAGSNYTISYTGANLTITPYALSVTADAQGKTYGAADPALTYTNGALQNGDTAAVFSGALTRAAGENVGVYAISQGTLSAGANYTISYTGANLTITPYALSVTADAQGKTYGAADPALTYTNGALQNGDTAAVFSGALTRAAGENVGAYAIGQGTLSAGSNYTISYTGANLTITPYALSVTADAQGKTYGAADPALTYTNGALQNGDTAAVFSGGLSRAAGENVGAYAIGQGTLSAGANYTISYTGANLTITPYLLTVNADAQSKTYGAADPALTYTSGALQNGDTAAVFSGALTRSVGEDVGLYAISQGTLSAGSNYTLAYVGAFLTVTPYALSVTADAQGKTYGAADPALTYSYGALQNGDTAAVFSGALTRAAGENVGAYAIGQGTVSAGFNYTISYTGANLTITPYALSVTADAQGKTYGAADPALTYTNGALQNGDTAAVFSGALTRAAGENVGAYAIGQGTLSAGSNYTISYTGANLTITPYTLSVTADAQGKTYGAADPALTYTNGALQNGDTAAVFSGALTRAAGENVGAYAIGQGTLSAGSNYTISYTGANLTITPYALSVTADAQGKTYGAADPALTYTNGALQNGDTAAVFSGALTRAAGENVGAYAISQGTLSAGANYTISYTGANLTITPYALSVTADAQGKTYGAADPALTYTNGALQNGDTAAVFSGALTRAAGENVGAYAIGQGTLSAGSNYTISYTGANLTITPYALSVTADAQGKTYGAADPALTYTNGALQNGDTAAVFSGALTRAAGENVGAYAIGQGTLSAGSNYTISYTGANLTITPYTLSVTADAQGKTYGAADPALTYTYGALQNGDTAAVFSGALTRVAGEDVGAYGILQGTLAAGSNYAISYAGANLTISPAAVALTITADNASKVYGTAYTFAGTEFTATGLQGADTVTGVTLTSVGAGASAGVGTYAIVASNAVGSGLGNYTITYVDGVMTVTPYTLSVTADAQGKTYGAADPALTYIYGALQGGDTAAVFSGGLSRAAGENVGTYAIGQGTLSAGANYTLSYTGANLTITPYALSVTADAQSKAYGAADPALTYTNGALQNGDTAAVFSGALTRAAGENVGAYAIGQGTLSAGSNYTISYTGANLSITPYVLSVTADAQGKTYGAADPALTYTNAALQNGDTAAVFSGALTRAAGENVGAYAIGQGTLSAGSNYTISYTGANLTITPYTLSVTADAQGKTYGAADPALTYTNGALQNGDTAAVFSGGLSRAAGENVGAYAIGQGTLSAGANYTISYTGANLTITPYTLSVTADAQGKTYGAADPALTYTNGALQNGDTAAVFSGALTRAAGENVGTYAIGQGTLSAGSNYTISYTGANLTITPYALSVTADAQGKTYGAADPALTYTNGALQNGDTAAVFSGALTRAAGENVGAYAISQGTLSAGSNYTISYTGANLTITPYALSVTADAQGKTYGAADPALTYTNGALQNGDTAAVFSGALTRAAGENVGTYAIGQGTLSAGSNYTISYTGANLTITPYALSVTADAQGKTYGAADPALTYTNGALQNGDTAAVFSGALTRAAGENVGAYAIGQGTLSAGSNYTITYTGANLTITPYALSVTADAQGKTYGAADPALTYTNGALQNGDTAAVFSGALTRAAGENVGAYAIGQGTLSAGSNYTITYTGANLTITPYALSVTADAQGKTYGAADPALTYTNGALQNGDTAAVFSGALTRAAGENVGAYAIGQGTLSAGSNYTISYTGANLTITPYALSVTADAQGKTYGAADPALTYTNGALQNGDTAAVFSGGLTRAAGENVGAYAIGQGTLSAGSNYTISYTGANLTITPYALSVTADAQGKTYGAADPALTYTNGALQNGDTAAVFSGGLSRAAGENVGAYAIGQGTLSAGANYTISYTAANLTITPYALSVTADAQGKTYGAADPALTYTNGALQNGDTAAVFSGALTRAAGENVGAYAISQGTLSAGANYTISYTGANLTITPYALSVTADAQGKTYGAADPALTYTNGALQNGDTAAVFSGALTRAAGENVGAYAISQGTLSAGSNYTITYTGANMTITPYALSVTADAQGKTYGAADPALTFTYGALQNGDTAAIFSGAMTRAAGENVGVYAIGQGTLAATANYTISFTGANLTITPYALSVVADAQGKTYGAADPALTYTYGALQNGDTAAVFSGALTRAAGENVGAYAIGQGTLSAGSNYTISYTGANLTITPYALSVTADAQGKTYGAADPALTYTSGALQNGDTAAVFSGALTRAAGENVGAYAIGQGTLSAGSNYTISYTGANLTITPYALTVTADAQGKTYGAADPALTYTYGALQNGDTAAVFTGAQTRVAGENVGVYAISQGTLSAGSNYTVAYTGANLTITPYALSVTADAQGKVYGAADPALTYTYGALQNGDTAAIFSGGLTRAAGENVGAYAIGQGTLAATANYTITYTGANLTITPYALSVTADAQGKTYGAADPALTYTNGALQNGDTAAVFSGALTRAAGENVGAYAIGQGTLSAGANYTISYTGANLTITPYALSVTADAQGKTYGAADPALTYTYGALQNGDTAAVFTGGLTRAAGQNVGVYAIGQGTLSAGGNYAITYTGANLTITPYALTITADAQGKTYGAADPALTYTYGALQNGDTAAIFSGAMTRAAGENVGLYAVAQGTLAASANYAVTFTGSNFTITPAALSIRAVNQTKTFGTAFAFAGTEFTTLGLTGGDSVTSVTLASPGSPGGAAAGVYAITASGAVGAGLANYTISYIDGTMTVLANGMIIPPTVMMKVQGEADNEEPDTSNININISTDSLGDASIMDSSDLISIDPALAEQLGLSKKMKREKRSGL